MVAVPKKVRSCIATYDTTLLCAWHIAKSLFLFSLPGINNGSRGFDFTSDGPQMRLYWQRTFGGTSFNNTYILRRGRKASGPLASVGANGFGRGS